jgi:Lrp/AsnC family transcriptional regulator for asnA, asnC and gidA
MSEVDTLDRAIIALLMEDGRMSSAEIARRVGAISERSVRYRVDRLLREGVIRVGAIVNPKAVGFPVVADVWLEIEPGHVLEVAHKMVELEETSFVACATGDRDISVQVYARNNEELYRFATEVLGNVPSVRKTNTILVPVVLKDVYDWLVPESACKEGKEGGP